MVMKHNNAKTAQHILIDIDCLFDTRIATIAEMDDSIATELVTGGKYYKRISDKFSIYDERINDDAFKAAYEKRDDYTISNAGITEFAFDLYSIVEGIIRAKQQNPEGVGDLKFFINQYPYRFSEEEKIDLIACIQCYLPTYVPLELVYLPLSEITTSYLKYKDIAGYFTYSLDDWVNATLKGKSLDDVVPIPAVGIFPCMMTAYDQKHMVQVIKENKNPHGEEADPFEATALGLASLIAVEWIPSHTYSLYGLAKANGEELNPTFR